MLSKVIQSDHVNLSQISFARGDLFRLSPLVIEQMSGLSKFIPQVFELADALNVESETGFSAVNVSHAKLLAGAFVGGVLYDMTSSSFGREIAQLHSARLISVTWVIDYLIDDFRMKKERRIEILQQMNETLMTGRTYQFEETAQLNAANLQLSILHRALVCAPGADRLRDAACNLMQRAVEQIELSPTIEVSVALGAATGAALGVVPYGWNVDLHPRYLRFMENIGAYLQLHDDLYDLKYDRSCGLSTFATECESWQEAESKMRPIANSLIEGAIESLDPNDIPGVKVLLGGIFNIWKPIRCFGKMKAAKV